MADQSPSDQAFARVVDGLPEYKSKPAAPLSLISYAPQAFESVATPMKVNLGVAQPMAAAPEAEPLTSIAAPAAAAASTAASAAAPVASTEFDAAAVRSAMTAAGVPSSHINAVMAAQGVAPVKNPAEPAMITRAELSKKQYEQQQNTYMENWNNQVNFLKSTGAYRPDQLNFKPPTFGGYKNTWGSYSNDLVANPYA